MTPSEQETVKYAKKYVGVLFPRSRLVERLKDLGADDIPIESLRIAAFLSPRDLRRISSMDPGAYREACARKIAANTR